MGIHAASLRRRAFGYFKIACCDPELKADASYELGDICFGLGQYSESLPYYKTAINSSPAGRPPAYGWYCQLAKAHSSLCEIEEALDVFKEGMEATGMSRHLRNAYRHGSVPPRTALHQDTPPQR